MTSHTEQVQGGGGRRPRAGSIKLRQGSPDAAEGMEAEYDEVGPDVSGKIASEVLVHPDVLASVMSQLGLRQANMVAAVCTAWHHASLCAQDEHRVLRPSHSLGWGNEALSQFRSPSGIIMLPTGELCVADTNNHRLQVLSRVTGDVLRIIGHGPGAGSGEFQQPTGLACDGQCLYVADSGNCRLHKLSLPDAKPLAMVGSFGDAAGQLHAPVGLALHGTYLFCADSRNHRIAVFATKPDLRFVRTFATHGTAAGHLGPTSSGIYIAAGDGELYVADRGNHRLQVFATESGALTRTIGRRGTAPGCFRRIRGVAVDARHIYTAECERVQVLSLIGEPLQVLPMPGSSALVGICVDAIHAVDQALRRCASSPSCRARAAPTSTRRRAPAGTCRPSCRRRRATDHRRRRHVAHSSRAAARPTRPPPCARSRAASPSRTSMGTGWRRRGRPRTLERGAGRTHTAPICVAPSARRVSPRLCCPLRPRVRGAR